MQGAPPGQTQFTPNKHIGAPRHRIEQGDSPIPTGKAVKQRNAIKN